MMKVIIYDCEIIKCIPNGAQFSGYEYCEGWRDFKNMGISVLGIIDIELGDTQAFIQDSMYDENFEITAREPEWKRLTEILKFLQCKHEGIVAGFNSHSFDDKLAQANYIHLESHVDILEEIRISAYGSPSWESQPKGYSYSLDAISKANGLKKSGIGTLVPQLWQDGQYREVIDYCLNDCIITREIFLKFLKGDLIDPNTGKKLKYISKASSPDVDDIPFLKQ